MFLGISQNSQENTFARISFLIKLEALGETLAQVFSWKFCEIFKNTFSTEHLRTTACSCYRIEQITPGNGNNVKNKLNTNNFDNDS